MTHPSSPMRTDNALCVINLWGAPSCGKSTLAAGLFYRMKRAGCDTELVPEAAKDLIHERNLRPFEDQMLILGEQYRRLWRLRGIYRSAISDSPLPLCLFYEMRERGLHEALQQAIWPLYGRFRNINVWVEASHGWHPHGRRHDATQARDIDDRLRTFMRDAGLIADTVGMDSDDPVEALWRIIDRRCPDILTPPPAD